MKKLALLLVATVMISGGAFAQDKACCKKGGKCPHAACCKDKKNCDKGSGTSTSSTSSSSTATKKEAAKKS